MISEFDLIKKYFTFDNSKRRGMIVDVGDDAAVIWGPWKKQMVIAMDTMVEGVHFLPGTDPRKLAHKIVAVNLSDLAAMGSEPLWITLALTLPSADESWLSAFSAGIKDMLDKYDIGLIGGDITKGPLTITVQAHGSNAYPYEDVLTRGGARKGDQIYVSGELGSAAGVLQHLQHKIELSDAEFDVLEPTLTEPTPQIDLGVCLRYWATSCIDISDGIAADLGHILEKSNVGATVQLEHLPINPIIKKHYSEQQAWELALTGGDDYQLCFTIPKKRLESFERSIGDFDIKLTHIGTIEKQPGLRLVKPDDSPYELKHAEGYKHF